MKLLTKNETKRLVAEQLVADAKNMQEVPHSDVAALLKLVRSQCDAGEQGCRIDFSPQDLAKHQACVDGADRLHECKIAQYGEK